MSEIYTCDCSKQFDSSKKFSCHKSKCKIFTKNKFDFLETIFDEVLDLYKIYSLNQISVRYDHKYISYSSLAKLLKRHNIPIRSIKQSQEIESTIKMREATCMRLYNSTNPMGGNSPHIKKREQTMLEKYGTKNVYSSDWFKHAIQQNDDFWVNRTGYTKSELQSIRSKTAWKNKSDEERNRWINNSLFSCTNSYISKLEKNTLDRLETLLHTNIERQHKVGRYFFDGYIKDKNILIEINGDYWHANPNKYASDDIIRFPSRVDKPVCEIWEKDKAKLHIASIFGYTTLVFWETDILKSDNLLDLYNDAYENQINQPSSVQFTSI